MLKAVLFDLDDTLIDWSTFTDQWETLETELLGGVFEYFRAEVHPLDDFETYVRRFMENSRLSWESANGSLIAPHVGRVLMQAAADMGAPIDNLDMERVLEAYKWKAVVGVAPFPEVIDALKLLHQFGVRTGIVTNAFQPMAMRDIEIGEHGLLDYFPDCRISAADVGYLKPHPTIFQTALDCLGTKAEETVFVGDNLTADIVGAQRSGMKAVWREVHSRFNPPSAFHELVKPDATVNDLSALPAIFDEWYPGWRPVDNNGANGHEN